MEWLYRQVDRQIMGSGAPALSVVLRFVRQGGALGGRVCRVQVHSRLVRLSFWEKKQTRNEVFSVVLIGPIKLR